jgi:hypothetical protein
MIMLTKLKVGFVLTIVLSLLALGSSCSKAPTNDTAATNDAATTTGKPFTPGDGSITGAIAFNGTAPAPKKIDTSADPVCGQANPNLSTEDTAVKDGKLANVFVYVKDGATADGTKVGDYAYPTPTSAVTLDQHGCHYVPHVMGIQTNQKLTITNSDPTQHNIHPTPKSNPEWNQTQPNGAAPIEKTFARAEVLIPVKCNQHPWMKSYIGVLKHPVLCSQRGRWNLHHQGASGRHLHSCCLALRRVPRVARTEPRRQCKSRFPPAAPARQTLHSARPQRLRPRAAWK